MNWDEFEVRVRSSIPQQELKPKRCWIGVLSHEKAPQDHLLESDFVWMIGHSVSYAESVWRHTAAVTS
jgi:hypothetical protein